MTISPESKTRLPWYFFALMLVSVLGTITFPELAEKQAQTALTLIGASAAFVCFLYSRHLEEIRMFSALFTEFNGRYDSLNNRLNEILARTDAQPLNEEDKRLLFDYFNLCAEEFYFHRAGYIPNDVWNSWRRGMQAYLKSPPIRDLLRSELKDESYYGLSLEIIEKP